MSSASRVVRRPGLLLVVLVVLLALMVASCGNDTEISAEASAEREAGSQQPMTLDEVAADLRDLIDSTAAEVLPGATPREFPESEDPSGQQLCSSTKDDRREDYWLIFDVVPSEIGAVVDRVQEHWESQGLDVSTGDGDVAPVSALVTLDGFEAVAAEVGTTGEVAIFGSTDCFPPA